MKILGVLLLTLSTSFAASNSSVTIKKDVEIGTLSETQKSYKATVKLEGGDCRIWFSSKTATTLKAGTKIEGSIDNVSEKSVSKDSDSVGKQGTTQFTFTSKDGNLEITPACFKNGLSATLIKLSLPDLEELDELMASELEFKAE